MKHLACTFTILLSLLAFSGWAYSQDQNEIGLYIDHDDLSVYSISLSEPGLITLYLVLTQPYGDCDGWWDPVPLDSISGFECMIDLPVWDELVGYYIDIPHFNVFTPPIFALGFSEPISVVDGQVCLGSILVSSRAHDGSYFYLRPIPDHPSIDGQMSYGYWANPDLVCLEAMYPISGSHDDPVFAVNGEVVPAESETWGNLKAMYR